MEYIYVEHPFPPIYNRESEILILGSFPSVRSREQKFYYGHPRNRFWQVISNVVGQSLPITIEEKTKLIPFFAAIETENPETSFFFKYLAKEI